MYLLTYEPAYLLVQRDFTVEVFCRQSVKILNLLIMVCLELCHCRVQDGLASCRYLLVLLQCGTR